MSESGRYNLSPIRSPYALMYGYNNEGEPLMSKSAGFCLTMAMARASCAGDGIEPLPVSGSPSAIFSTQSTLYN